MMRSFLIVATFLVAVSSFAPLARRGQLPMKLIQRHMFDPSPNDSATEARPLEVVVDGESAAAPVAEAPSKPAGTTTMLVKNLAKGGEVKEVKFYDPAMAANTNPLQMEWWAYFFVIFPFVLLANDFLHFLPTEGPLAFLSNY